MTLKDDILRFNSTVLTDRRHCTNDNCRCTSTEVGVTKCLQVTKKTRVDTAFERVSWIKQQPITKEESSGIQRNQLQRYLTDEA